MRAGREKVLFLLVLIAALALQSCSWIFVNGPPDRELWDDVEYASCTTGKGLPILDVVLAVSELIGGIVYVAAEDQSDEARIGGLAEGLLGTLIFTASATYGFKATSRCEEFYLYQASHRRSNESQPEAPPQYYYPPPSYYPPPYYPPPQQYQYPSQQPPPDDENSSP